MYKCKERYQLLGNLLKKNLAIHKYASRDDFRNENSINQSK